MNFKPQFSCRSIELKEAKNHECKEKAKSLNDEYYSVKDKIQETSEEADELLKKTGSLKLLLLK